MKKVVAMILCVGLLSMAVFAQSKPSRPRVVVTDNLPNNQNQTTNNDSNSPTTTPTSTPETTKRPPVLIGDNKPITPSSTPNKDGAVVEDDDVINIETNLVTLPVTVLDRDGRFISGLQQKDFQIFEDGVQQQVEYFASLEAPFTVVLLLDVSESTKFKIEEIQDAAITFVNQLRRDDRVSVIAFDEKIHVLAQATNDRNVLRNAIQQARFGGGTSLYEAVDYAINNQLRNIEGRKAVVLFTDGVDTTSKRATYQSTVKEAEELDAMIYPIRYDTSMDMGTTGGGGTNNPNPPRNRRRSGGGWGQIIGAILTGGSVNIGGGGGIGTSKEDYEKARQYLQELSQASGGRNFDATSTYNLDAAFSGIAEELRRQYSIGYYPQKEGQPGDRKQIKVRVNRTNAVVRAKNNYIVGQNGVASSTTAAKQKPKPTVKTRLPF